MLSCTDADGFYGSVDPGNYDDVGTENLLTNVPLFFPLLQILDVKNVLVVVSRWFGGILLGGELLCTL